MGDKVNNSELIRQIQNLNIQGLKVEAVSVDRAELGNLLNGSTQRPDATQQQAVSTHNSNSQTSTKIDNKGNTIATVKTFGKNGKLAKTSTVVTNKDGKFISLSTTTYSYDKNGNLLENKTVQKTARKTVTTKRKFNEAGKLSSTETSAVQKQGKHTLKSRQTTTFEYKDNKLIRTRTIGKDAENKSFETIDEYSDDGKTLNKRTKEYYQRGGRIYDVYEGENLKNRIQGGMPSQRIEYDSDGKTIKNTIENEFDENGVLIGRKILDKDNKIVVQKDFSKVDGVFDTAYQIGKGDCYLLSAINSLSQTESGQKLLQKNVKVSTNSNGEKVYTVSLPGAQNARIALINGAGGAKLGKLPQEKVHIQGAYTVTEAELNEAAKRAGKDYSAGDKDVLLLEVAYEKYRKDVAKTIQDNKINPNQTQDVAGLGISSLEDDYLSGGTTAEAVYILTGTKSEVYKPSKKPPTCYIDSNLQMHVTDDNGDITDNNEKAITVTANSINANIDELLENLKQDSKDGKIDDYAATASFYVSSQEINGSVIKGAGHAFTIRKVTDNEVILSNPWNPDTDIKMPIEDFKKAAKSMSCAKLENTHQGGAASTTGTVPPNGIAPTGEITPNNDGNGNVKKITVQKGEGYVAILKRELKAQGIEPTKENIKKAKKQFEAANPGAVQNYTGKIKKWYNNEFLYKGAEVIIPKFEV